MLIHRFILIIWSFIIVVKAQYQHSFHATDTPYLENPVDLTLKSIYHHSSANGPTPGLFRRHEVIRTTTSIKQNEQELPTYSLSPTLGHYERLNEQAKAYLIQQSINNDVHLSSGYRPKKVRWKRLAALTALNNDIIKETVQDLIPDVTNRSTVLTLAMMTSNAYTGADNMTNWYDLGEPWNLNSSFGWKSDGVRGHVFSNADKSLMVISFKGTSVGLWKDGPTGGNDKINDNMLFSCCCGRIGRVWSPVCDCYEENDYVCKVDCLEMIILKTEFYYDHAMAIYLDVAEQYPNATIWLTGHSLGGSLASLVGQTYGVPALSFEAPGDKLASTRLHLPHFDNMPLWHFGHTADPIFIGECSGPGSSCWYGGFAMESRCHTGKLCIWDTVKSYGWRVDALTHRIKNVINEILNRKQNVLPLPECKKETRCQDCEMWTFTDKRGGKPPSGSSTSTTAPTISEPPDNPWTINT